MVVFMGRMFIQGPDPRGWQSREKGKGGDLESRGGSRRDRSEAALPVRSRHIPVLKGASPACSSKITGECK